MRIRRSVKLSEALVAFEAAPVILAEGGQNRVTEGKLGFSQVAAHEVRLFKTKSGALQQLSGQQQTGAAIEQ